MRPRRLKVEFYDAEGVRHTISIDGAVTKEKVGKILDLVELMGGTSLASPLSMGRSQRKFDRLATMIFSQFKEQPFSSGDVKKTFESSFREKIPLSTVSTYLIRLLDRGILDREAGKNGLVYRVRPGEQRQPLAHGPVEQAS